MRISAILVGGVERKMEATLSISGVGLGVGGWGYRVLAKTGVTQALRRADTRITWCTTNSYAGVRGAMEALHRTELLQ